MMAVRMRAMFILESLCWPGIYMCVLGVVRMIYGGRTVVVDDGAYEAVAVEHGERLERLAFAHDVGRLHVLLPSEDIVQLAARKVIRDLPVPMQR